MKSQLHDNLFIGNWHDARDRAEGMHVVTVACDSEFKGQEFFPLVDGPGNDPGNIIRAVAAVVNSARLKPTMVHCIGGRSRSGVVAVLALMQLMNCSAYEAYDHLISRHSETRIHPALSTYITLLA